MNYRDMKSVTVLGIGGKGAYYITKFLLLLGKDVYGYDLKKNERCEDLERLGAKITYDNPALDEKFSTDAYIYSNDLPQKIQKPIQDANTHIPGWEVGEMYHKILEDYESNMFDERELKAFVESEIAPLYQVDQSKMKYIAVTGTDGKTTTATMIYYILKENGFKPALVTTVSAKIGEMDIDTGFHTTTPTSQEIFNLIQRAQEEECSHIILETTSHGLIQGRIMGLKFDAVAYTNVTEEHLDYHKSWENLLAAKSLLITKHTKVESIVVLNRDDERSFSKLKELHTFVEYSKEEQADIYASDIEVLGDGISFKLTSKDESTVTNLPILGEYNVSNFLAASGVVRFLDGVSLSDIASSIASFETIKGRMEVIQKDPFVVIVDYAHTPNSLESVLTSAKQLTKGRIIHIFGCAGHRDFYKRPVMGEISNRLADITILTAEDPRLESLREINDQIEEGWRKGGRSESELIRFDDDTRDVKVRRESIRRGIKLAQEGDLVIVTGKAHETSLCFGQIEYPWNDIDEVKQLLNTTS